MSEYILQMKNITKVFPGVKALNSVNLAVKRGEIHGICGENGAGKSTLIKVLCGVYPYGSYEGEIILDGQEKKFYNIKDAEDEGIVCIHQELALVPELNVAENIFLSNKPNVHGIINWNELYVRTQKLLNEVDLSVNPEEKVKNLGIGQQQMVEIAKALSKKVKILILDEPTAALTEKEVETLFELLKKLKEKGVTCIYISHKLDEVMQIVDSVTVLRDGCSIGTKKKEDLTKDLIIRMMVGRELTNLFPKEIHIRQEVGFEVKNYTVLHPEIPGKKIIDNVSFKAYKGEILGVSGLLGAGRSELFCSIFGIYPAKSEGEVYIGDKKVDIKCPTDAIENGLMLLPEDRKKSGLVLDMNIKENVTLSSLERVSRKNILNENEEIYHTNNSITYLKVKAPSIEEKVKNLSGGNQQKVLLAKALLTKPKVLILDEPTRGIDVGAKYEIYKIMNQLVDSGVTVIMISSELEEILGMSDRIIVICEGQLKGEFTSDEATPEKIMCAATGGN